VSILDSNCCQLGSMTSNIM